MDGNPIMESMSISEFYRGRSVFITGATGFMGKVLLEKLLRCCPEIQNVYMIVRSKRGRKPEDRLKVIFQIPLFDRLKEEQPGVLDKVVAMEGDMMELKLGLSPEDQLTLQERVSVVFHAAATVRFDDPIKSAVTMNVRGTREILDLAASMKKLKVFLHVSTTFCNTDHFEIDEVVYPIASNWKKMIQAVETLDSHTLKMLTPKIIGMRPNTYTYTKALAEQLVDEYSSALPVVIFRPSIVVSCLQEPLPGWVDSFNGPIGLMSALGKGIMSTLHADPDMAGDYVPVDLAIRGMVVASWHRGCSPTQPSDGVVDVYNCATGPTLSITMSQLFSRGLAWSRVYPLNDVIWYPGASPTRNTFVYYFKAILLHFLPALVLDGVLLLMGKKRILLMLQRRIYIANKTLKYFWMNQWTFLNKRFEKLDKCILPDDRKDWSYILEVLDLDEFFRVFFAGGRQYLLKEDASTIPRAKRHLEKMYWIDRATKAIAVLLTIWWLSTTSLLGMSQFMTCQSNEIYIVTNINHNQNV